MGERWKGRRCDSGGVDRANKDTKSYCEASGGADSGRDSGYEPWIKGAKVASFIHNQGLETTKATSTSSPSANSEADEADEWTIPHHGWLRRSLHNHRVTCAAADTVEPELTTSARFSATAGELHENAVASLQKILICQ